MLSASRVAVSALLTLLSLPVLTHAATYYVATNGDDSRPCSGNGGINAQNINTPKRTINSGRACLQGGGDTLYIRGGDYAETVNWVNATASSWTNPILISAYTSDGGQTYETVWITTKLEMGPGPGTPGIDGEYIIYDHLRVSGPPNGREAIAVGRGRHRFQNGEVTSRFSGSSCPPPNVAGGLLVYVNDGSLGTEFINNDMHDTICGYAFYITTSNFAAHNNRMWNLGGYTLQVYHEGDSAMKTNVVITNNIIHNTGSAWGHCAMTFYVTDGALVANNVIYNTLCGINVWNSSRNVRIYHNTFYNNAGGGMSGIVNTANGATGTLIRNNLSYGGISQVVDNQGGGATWSALDNTVAGSSPYVNAGADFHLQSGIAVPCLGDVPTDIEGNARPQGSACDIGAYEFGGSGGVPLPSPTNLRLLTQTP